MNDNEAPLEGAAPQDGGERIEETLAAMDAAVAAGNQMAADAATEAEAAIEALAGAATDQGASIAETLPVEEPPAEVGGVPATLAAPPRQQNGAPKQTFTDRLTESRTYDPDATNDDRIMAALAYLSQLIFPLGFILPVIILISETSKRRPFQRYHAVQSLALGVIIWTLLVIYSMSWATVGWILWLCLCVLLPLSIALWLLPAYYAMLAYNGKRFRIRGLTQFLEDQRWL